MDILYLLVPLSLLLITVGVGRFIWSVRNGQYDDLDSPAHRILHDDDDPMIPPEARPPGKGRENGEKDANQP